MAAVSIPAAVQRPRSKPIRVIVFHDPGQPDISQGVSAEGVARFNATPPDQRRPPGSGGYHVLEDKNVEVVAAPDGNRVNGAAGANEDGLHLCWCDYSLDALKRGAAKVNAWCAAHSIPKVQLSAGMFNAGARGLVSHADVEIAIHATSPHTDPRQFPWALFMRLLDPPPVPQEEPDVPNIIQVERDGQPANRKPYLFLDKPNRRVTSCWRAEIAWDGGDGDSVNHATGDPNVTWIGIPGEAPIVAVEAVRGTWSADGKSVRVCAYGTQGAEYFGTAHG